MCKLSLKREPGQQGSSKVTKFMKRVLGHALPAMTSMEDQKQSKPTA